MQVRKQGLNLTQSNLVWNKSELMSTAGLANGMTRDIEGRIVPRVPSSLDAADALGKAIPNTLINTVNIIGYLGSATSGSTYTPIPTLAYRNDTLGLAAELAMGGAVGIRLKASTAVGASVGEAANGLRTSAVISAERAETFLIKSGMSTDRAASYVASFDGPISARLVRPGESFLRYADVANSSGNFLMKTQFSNSTAAVNGLYLGPFGNNALFIQSVTSTGRSIVLEGSIANGGVGIRQSVIINRGVFQFGTGTGY